MKIIFFTILILSSHLLFAQYNGEPAIVIHERNLIPEGIAYSSQTQAFYISSIHQHKIIIVDFENNVRDFILTGQDGFMSGVGLKVDDENKLLYALSGQNKDGQYFTGLFKYDLAGKLKDKIILQDTIPSMFNDLVVDDKGNVYITDTFRHTVFLYEAKSSKLTPFVVSEEIKYPNGITLSRDSKYLYIASTTEGIKRVDLSTKEISSIHNHGEEITTKGIDGLMYFENSLIGIVNASREKTEHRIIRCYLDVGGDKQVKFETIDKGNSFFDVPTTGAIVGSELYCIANSQLDNLDQEKHIIRSVEKLKDIVILKYQLETSR